MYIFYSPDHYRFLGAAFWAFANYNELTSTALRFRMIVRQNLELENLQFWIVTDIRSDRLLDWSRHVFRLSSLGCTETSDNLLRSTSAIPGVVLTKRWPSVRTSKSTRIIMRFKDRTILSIKRYYCTCYNRKNKT